MAEKPCLLVLITILVEGSNWRMYIPQCAARPCRLSLAAMHPILQFSTSKTSRVYIVHVMCTAETIDMYESPPVPAL